MKIEIWKIYSDEYRIHLDDIELREDIMKLVGYRRISSTIYDKGKVVAWELAIDAKDIKNVRKLIKDKEESIKNAQKRLKEKSKVEKSNKKSKKDNKLFW